MLVLSLSLLQAQIMGFWNLDCFYSLLFHCVNCSISKLKQPVLHLLQFRGFICSGCSAPLLDPSLAACFLHPLGHAENSRPLDFKFILILHGCFLSRAFSWVQTLSPLFITRLGRSRAIQRNYLERQRCHIWCIRSDHGIVWIPDNEDLP